MKVQLALGSLPPREAFDWHAIEQEIAAAEQRLRASVQKFERSLTPKERELWWRGQRYRSLPPRPAPR